MANYLALITQSAGEIGVAKEGYVMAQTGWMSDRTTAYLGCGRPVVAQDTGWSPLIGEHAGLRAFSTLKEASDAIREIEFNYGEANRSALEVSDKIFDARKVIQRLLPRIAFPKCAAEATTA